MQSASRYVAVILVTAALVGASTWYASAPRPTAPPVTTPIESPTEAQFRGIGKAYGPELAKAYAVAHLEGVKVLDAGGTVDAAVAAIAANWTAARSKLYADRVVFELDAIIPNGTQAKAVTPAERVAMSQAFRGFAKGLAP